MKFQASSHLLWLYSPECAGPGRKPRRPVFSQRGSFIELVKIHPLFVVDERCSCQYIYKSLANFSNGKVYKDFDILNMAISNCEYAILVLINFARLLILY